MNGMRWRWRKGPGSKSGRAGVRRGRAWRYVAGPVLILVVLVVCARLALPGYLEAYANRTLDQSPDYDGRVGTVDVDLWRGMYAVHDVSVVKTTNAVPVPFFECPLVEFSLDWNALYRGAMRTKILIEKPKLNFVQGPTEEESQTGGDQPWLDILNQLAPFRVDKAEVRDGRVHFRAFHTRPPVNVFLTDVQAQVTNLSNIEGDIDPLIAHVRARGTAMDSGRFRFEMSLDPKSHRPSFDMAVQLLDMDVTRLNSLALAYGDFDFTSGSFDFVLEVTTKDGFVQGYAKPLFRNVKVLSLRDVQNDNPLQLLWEALVGAVGAVFTNQSRDQFGTRITISGNLDGPRTDILEVVGNVLRNAFVRAYLPSIERRVDGESLRAAGDGGIEFRSDR